MAQAASGNDIYLALLAGRAVTALAKLARDPQLWTDQIEQDLRNGLSFCAELQVPTEHEGAAPPVPEFGNVLKRLSQFMPGPTFVSADEICAVTKMLGEWLNRERKPQTEDLSLAIDFFLKASSGQSIKSPEGSLFGL
jgi:hypothetical protein